MPNGPAKGHVAQLDEMLPRYYAHRGWDERGDLTPKKAEELGLELRARA
jgi:aldehyde:ferredoxin oxidoreductase